MNVVRVGDRKAGGFEVGGERLTIIGGPCVIEDAGICLEAAKEMKVLTAKHGLNYIFKSSFEKDNRSSADSYKGPGITEGLLPWRV